MLRDALMRDPRMTHKEVNASQILQMFQESWVRAQRQRKFPRMCLDTVRRMLRRWGWSWRRAHRRRRPDVDPQSAIHFVFHILYLQAEGVDPADVVDADEIAFLLYPQGFYTWAIRGSEAVQIHVAGIEKRSYTVMAAITMTGGKLPLFTVVQGGHCEQSGGRNWTLRDHTRRRTVRLGG
jgi:hypothetical protein